MCVGVWHEEICALTAVKAQNLNRFHGDFVTSAKEIMLYLGEFLFEGVFVC